MRINAKEWLSNPKSLFSKIGGQKALENAEAALEHLLGKVSSNTMLSPSQLQHVENGLVKISNSRTAPDTTELESLVSYLNSTT